MQMQKKPKPKPTNRARLNVYLEVGLALVFVVQLERHFTGQALHELLGLLFTAGLALHLILHWQWVVTLTRTFFKKLFHESRYKYILNMALLINVILMVITGILIARTLWLNFQIPNPLYGLLEKIHSLASDFSLLLIGLHIATSWKWIATNTKKFLFSFNFLKRKTPPNQPVVGKEAVAKPISTSEV